MSANMIIRIRIIKDIAYDQSVFDTKTKLRPLGGK